jgi:hypothetical protein
MAKKESNSNKTNLNEEFAEEVNAVDVDELKAQMYEEIKKQVEADLLTKQSIEELKEEEKATTVKKIQRKEAIDKQMLVPIMNVTNGKLIYQSKKSGSEFQFEHYGDIEYIELYELLTMRSSQRKFLDEPYVIVLDDEVADYLGLSNMYKKLTHATEIDRIFKMPLEQFKNIVESTPKGLAHLIISKAKEKITSGEFDSVQKIQVLEEIYNVPLNS